MYVHSKVHPSTRINVLLTRIYTGMFYNNVLSRTFSTNLRSRGKEERPSGLMDKALDFESKDCRFESCLGRILFCSIHILFCISTHFAFIFAMLMNFCTTIKISLYKSFQFFFFFHYMHRII